MRGGPRLLLTGALTVLGIYAQLLDLHRQSNPAGEHSVLVERAELGGPLVNLDRATLQSAARETGASSELVEGIARIQTSGPSLAALGRSRGMPLIDPEELSGHFRTAPSPQVGWSSLLQRFEPAPGVLQYSPVVRSREGDEALVIETFRCGPECGQSRMLLLQEGIEGWTVMAEVPLWVP
ncbi:MAG: hypothetical protein EA351_04480 [Gemmatimonadales bacterium]|nr:MAG: hypothetical protein EA351_04480 [Gemmatimonadales bacterium]